MSWQELGVSCLARSLLRALPVRRVRGPLLLVVLLSGTRASLLTTRKRRGLRLFLLEFTSDTWDTGVVSVGSFALLEVVMLWASLSEASRVVGSVLNEVIRPPSCCGDWGLGRP